jgi:hypothetical protein
MHYSCRVTRRMHMYRPASHCTAPHCDCVWPRPPLQMNRDVKQLSLVDGTMTVEPGFDPGVDPYMPPADHAPLLAAVRNKSLTNLLW